MKAIQERKGSRGAYAKQEERGGWQTSITPEHNSFIVATHRVLFKPPHTAG